MDIENLKPNSHKYNDEQKKLEKVVSGTVKTRQKGLGRRFVDTFFNEDRDSVKEYLFTDVFVPAVKNTIIELITQGINLIFYGETRKTSSVLGSRTSYNRMFKPDSGKPGIQRGRTMKDLGDIVLDSKGEAERVIDILNDLLNQYGQATVGDLFDLLGETIPGDFTSRDWGWTDLRGARSIRVRDGYLLDLPRCISLK